MNSSIPAKDVIYIDVEDEITTIIDKVRSSQSKIVALVLPKRATTLQSAVNMKLLKRGADEGKKHLVLITSETGLLPLAAATGMYVAKNLQSKPEIPVVPHNAAAQAEDQEETVTLDDEPLNRQAPVGDLARGAVISPTSPRSMPDSSAKNAAKPVAPVVGNIAGKKGGDKSKGMKVPNFNRFRKLIIFGSIGLVLLVFGLYMALSVMPKAKILVKTDSEAVSANVSLALSTKADAVDVDESLVPAKSQELQKTYTEQASATGQKNTGQKASGNIRIVNCNDDTVTLPAGTGFSSGSSTFISQSGVSVPGSNFKSDGSCKEDGKAVVSVVAQNPGASYNLGSTTYSIANGPAKLKAEGDSMTGGTDNITKVIQQSDIDNAKQKISSQDTSEIKRQMQNQLTNSGYHAIVATFSAGTPTVTTSAKAGDPGDAVTVTEKVTYTMLGAKASDLEKVIKTAVEDDIDEKKQSILDYGLDDADYSTPSPTATGATTTMRVTVVAGPDLDIDNLTKQVAGKKSGDAKAIIKAYPGVTDVDISYSPFWVTSIPGKTSKITITIDKPQTRSNAE